MVLGPGESTAERQRQEEGYRRQLAREVTPFLQFVERSALAGTLSPAAVFAAWEALVTSLTRGRETSAFAQFLRSVEIPEQALAAATFGLATAEGQALGAQGRRQAVRVALGLDATGPTDLAALGTAAAGRMLTREGAFNWLGSIDSVARTASTADFAQQQIQEGRDEGYRLKRWSTRFDDRVRDTHRAADRQTVPLDAAFTVGGEVLAFPGDPNGSLEETINCRCLIILVRDDPHPWDAPAGTEPWNDPRPV